MTETVLIALISAASGVFGALFGALGAVIGPWWLKKLELGAERERSYLDARRAAIVAFSNAKLDVMREYHQVFVLGGSGMGKLTEAIGNANKTATELFSLIKKEDASVKKWINSMGHKSLMLKPKTIEELSRVDAFLGIGVQHLIAWHVGELVTSELRPFGLDKSCESVWLKEWNEPWPQ